MKRRVLLHDSAVVLSVLSPAALAAHGLRRCK